MNRIDTPEQAVRLWKDVYTEALGDAILPDLSEVIASRSDIRTAVIAIQQEYLNAQDGELAHPDSTNPRYNPDILDRIDALRRRLGDVDAAERPNVLGQIARGDPALSEILVFDPMIANQILDEDTL